MPGKDPNAAVRAFIEPIQDAASCITTARVRSDRHHYDDHSDGALDLGLSSAQLARSVDHEAPGLVLEMTLAFRLLLNEKGHPRREKWRVSATTYYYHVMTDLGEEVLSYHWHPEPPNKVTTPHLHVGSSELSVASRLTNKDHLPTGRVAFEELAIFLIEEFGLVPLRPDYRAVIEPRLDAFKAHRTWP